MATTRVTYEQAVKLKEVGCNICDTYWHKGELKQTAIVHGQKELVNVSQYTECVPAPTLHEAADWLRTKGLHVAVLPVDNWNKWRIRIFHNTFPPQKYNIPDKPTDFDTHDTALSEAITHSLTLLTDKKQKEEK